MRAPILVNCLWVPELQTSLSSGYTIPSICFTVNFDISSRKQTSEDTLKTSKADSLVRDIPETCQNEKSEEQRKCWRPQSHLSHDLSWLHERGVIGKMWPSHGATREEGSPENEGTASGCHMITSTGICTWVIRLTLFLNPVRILHWVVIMLQAIFIY